MLARPWPIFSGAIDPAAGLSVTPPVRRRSLIRPDSFVCAEEARIVCIHGVTSLDLPCHSDQRGSLIALDRDRGIPFAPQRVFFMVDCPSDAVRGAHAVSADMVLLAIRGRVSITVDNGVERTAVVLSRPEQGLHVRRGVWVQLHDFAPETVVLVVSAENYKDVTYHPAPNPELFDQSMRKGAA